MFSRWITKVFNRRYLLFTNLGISFCLSGVGDILQQKAEHYTRNKPNTKWNFSRTLHMSTSFGLTSGFLCHFWYNYLDKLFPGKDFRIVLVKIVVDQVAFSPILIVTCLTLAGAVEQKSALHISKDVVNKGAQLYLAECFIWPPAQFINFYFLPTKYRVLYDNTISFGYDWGRTGAILRKSQYLNEISGSSFSGVHLIGENHLDPQSHLLELVILQNMRPDVLSLEFWDREAQPVINEYLRDLVDRETFLRDSRPPSNHEDYMSLIDHCKDAGISVIGSNCPKRYTRMVRCHGTSTVLAKLDELSLRLLPPPDPAEPSLEYKKAFKDIMGQVSSTMDPQKLKGMLEAQSLWDATMAHSISKELQKKESVLHISGYFHIQRNMGILEHLRRYAPQCQILTTVILPEENYKEFSHDKHKGVADYVVLTDISKLHSFP